MWKLIHLRHETCSAARRVSPSPPPPEREAWRVLKPVPHSGVLGRFKNSVLFYAVEFLLLGMRPVSKQNEAG